MKNFTSEMSVKSSSNDSLEVLDIIRPAIMLEPIIKRTGPMIIDANPIRTTMPAINGILYLVFNHSY